MVAKKSSAPDPETELMTEPDRDVALRKMGGVLNLKVEGETRELPVRDDIVIGSSPNADLELADPAISRVHCRLEVGEDGVWLRDLGSRNGSFVEGLRVTAARLADDCRIRLGSTMIRFSYETRSIEVDGWPVDHFGQLVGRSSAMRALFALLAKYAQRDAPVLIQGETGTGKELVARSLHEASARRKKAFIVVDCGALPENLIEAELFGHARGAFTGATGAREGAIEAADGGTVFLDEIGELPLALQPKLLRALESGTVRRIGESEHRNVDVRFVSATHRDLLEMLNEGTFREDLYFRIAVLPAHIPALRERREDLGLLIEHFLPADAPPDMAVQLTAALDARPFRGNVRELRNLVERALAVGTDHSLQLGGIPERRADAKSLPAVATDRPFKELRQHWLEHLEREYIRKMIEQHGRSLSTIADASGLDRSYVYRLIRKHDL